MVKLLKHELFALFRILLFFGAAVVVFAALGRVMIAVDANREESTLSFVFIMFYVFAILSLIAAAWALGVSRFAKTLFTGEGYMTLSLPISSTKLILAKLISAIIAMAFATVVSVLSSAIFLIGVKQSVLDTIFGIFSFLSELAEMNGLFVFELIVLVIVMIPMSLLLLYAILSVGQLFTSRRKGLTFLLAVGVYMAIQLLSTFGIAPMLEAAHRVSIHLSIWTLTLLVAGVDVSCFFLVRYILKNKVNLIA